MVKILKFITCITLGFIAMLFVAMSGAFLYLSPNLPDVNTLTDIRLQIPLRIYSSDGQLIGEFGEQRRTPIAFNDIPADFVNAFIAGEDTRFYSHPGVSAKGLSRAIVQMATGSEVQTGGSTITMQVAKNYFLTPERNIIRKVREIFLALQIEQHLTKQQILELYVNKIFLGHRAYGIVAAAQVYYGKPVNELTLEQFATIAGIPKAPSDFNPITNPERAKIRRDWILMRMRKHGFITLEQQIEARDTPITAKRHQMILDTEAPYIAEMARLQAIQIYGENAYIDGLKVYTTINSRLQNKAQLAVKDGLHSYDNRHGFRRPHHFPDISDAGRRKAFTQLASIGDLQPAITVSVKEQTVNAVLRDGQEIAIDWESIANKRQYISENRVGGAPKNASELIKAGDVLYVKQNEEQLWQLFQIPQAEAALVSLNPNTGGILALVGGYDFYKSKFNRAIQAERQIGSTIKPFVYAAALANGYTAASIINDAPLVIESSEMEDVWRPRNAGAFSGPTRLRSALYQSKNLVSVRILRDVGVNKTISYLSQFGFDAKKLPRDLSLALGSPTFTPMDVTRAYAVFANGGYLIEPYLIESIYSSDGERIYQANPAIACKQCTQANPSTEQSEDISTENADLNNNEPAPRYAPRVISEDIVFIIDNILQDTIRRGTATRARALERNDIAGKTGTTNGPTDAWFAGYHANVVTTTWLGLNNNTPLGQNEYGGTSALPIWVDFMKLALENQPVAVKEQPASVTSVLIDRSTGRRTHPGAENSMFEFIQNSSLESLDAQSTQTEQNAVSIEDIF